MSAADEYLKWRRTPAIGCAFARAMSRVPSDYGQVVEELGYDDPAAVAIAIVSRVDQLVPNLRVLAAAFVLPRIETLEKLITMALALPTDPNWHVDVRRLEPPPQMDLVAIRVVRDLPFGSGTLPSEALVMGNFDVFPNTRRAPCTAFEIYVGDPAPQDPKEHTPSTKANFAHIDFRDRTLINVDFPQDAVDNMWEQSKARRRISLGGIDDRRAKAKVSFVVPTALAQKMGCIS
jgi:hypothetical protein